MKATLESERLSAMAAAEEAGARTEELEKQIACLRDSLAAATSAAAAPMHATTGVASTAGEDAADAGNTPATDDAAMKQGDSSPRVDASAALSPGSDPEEGEMGGEETEGQKEREEAGETVASLRGQVDEMKSQLEKVTEEALSLSQYVQQLEEQLAGKVRDEIREFVLYKGRCVSGLCDKVGG